MPYSSRPVVEEADLITDFLDDRAAALLYPHILPLGGELGKKIEVVRLYRHLWTTRRSLADIAEVGELIGDRRLANLSIGEVDYDQLETRDGIHTFSTDLFGKRQNWVTDSRGRIRYADDKAVGILHGIDAAVVRQCKIEDCRKFYISTRKDQKNCFDRHGSKGNYPSDGKKAAAEECHAAENEFTRKNLEKRFGKEESRISIMLAWKKTFQIRHPQIYSGETGKIGTKKNPYLFDADVFRRVHPHWVGKGFLLSAIVATDLMKNSLDMEERRLWRTAFNFQSTIEKNITVVDLTGEDADIVDEIYGRLSKQAYTPTETTSLTAEKYESGNIKYTKVSAAIAAWRNGATLVIDRADADFYRTIRRILFEYLEEIKLREKSKFIQLCKKTNPYQRRSAKFPFYLNIKNWHGFADE